MKKIDVFISVIVCIRNDADILGAFLEDTFAVLKANYSNYEIVLVDSASADDTGRIVGGLLGRIDCVRYIRLSAKSEEEIAVSAGLDTVIGDFVVIISPGIDPIKLIPDIVEKARKGSGVVFGVFKDRKGQGIVNRFGTAVFYWYATKVLKLKMPQNTTGFRALSRKAVNALLKIKESNRYLRLLGSYTGFEIDTFEYRQAKGAKRKLSKDIVKQFTLAKNIIVSNSMHPLRFVTVLGLLASLANFVYLLYVILIYFFKKDVAEGWTTTSFIMTSMFLLLFLILTVLSEYIGEILKESKDRPLYHVYEEKCSSVLVVDENRRNIVKDSD